jgi:hypothetical protein
MSIRKRKGLREQIPIPMECLGKYFTSKGHRVVSSGRACVESDFFCFAEYDVLKRTLHSSKMAKFLSILDTTI